jgi:hypothetical protein
MQNPINQIFDKLNEFSSTMKLRQEAYLHASRLAGFPAQERDTLENCVQKSADSLHFIEERLEDISANVSQLPKQPQIPLKCSLYYAIAKSTTNKMTVYLSLQLGDLWFLKKFEEYYNSLDLDQFRCLREETKKHIECLKSGICFPGNQLRLS